MNRISSQRKQNNMLKTNMVHVYLNSYFINQNITCPRKICIMQMITGKMNSISKSQHC